MNAKEIIAKKRDGGELTADEIEFFVLEAADGRIPDYQVSAWLMSIYFQGLSREETACMTRAMIRSGDTLPRVGDHPLPVDKHSTGGVGDKVSFLVAPLVAAAGAPVPMISGRSLGHTGGTLDKLEAIAGYETAPSPDDFVRCVRERGLCIAGQSDRLVPADRLFYSLRDAASIVESIPLITSSILSKKVAEGIGALVLDVKFGRGAFMSDKERARELAGWLVGTGRRLGLKTRAYLTDMNFVLGRTAGNALEIRESIESLREGPDATAADLREVTLALGEGMLVLSGVAGNEAEARGILEDVWNDGRAWESFRGMVEQQGGDLAMIDDPGLLPNSPHEIDFHAPRAGRLKGLHARPVGDWLTRSGGGRLVQADVIDQRVGVELRVELGTSLEVGDVVGRLYLREAADDEEELQALAASWIEFGEPRDTLVDEVIG